ncbi:hypothetical protein C8J55DRAFT_133053 [Lentinula edodes]|uniref:Uncharacterized protein n=1 Tax=Lentinula lateritia TaxID=40482 RepID=A0A9W9A400_9AGAR|nr:hypothetical protein C8J55DRAFT_133053 [Lentinula edodes]
MGVISFIRCAVALYGLTLEAFYPFDALPVSDEIKETLKAQAKNVNSSSAIISLSCLTSFLYLVAVFSVIHGAVRIAMYYRPKFRELVERCMAERALKAPNKKNHPKRTDLRSVMFNLLFSVLLIVNDIIFNRPEDASSFKEGVTERFEYLLQGVTSIAYAQFLALSCTFIFAVFFPAARAISRSCRQRRIAADKESRLTPSDMAEVEAEGQKTFILEQLVDLSDGFDAIFEKLESL